MSDERLTYESWCSNGHDRIWHAVGPCPLCAALAALAAAERERDEAYDRAAKVADEFDFGLGSQSQLVSAIRALAKEREA